MRRRSWFYLALAIAAGPLAGSSAAENEPDPGAAAIRLAPAPPNPERRELLRRWRQQSRDPLAPILREWRHLARAARQGPGSRLTAGCRRLDLALGELDRARLPEAPDPSVSLHLEETLRTLGEAADSCSQGAYFLTAWRLRAAAESWRQLRGRLLLYGLWPRARRLPRPDRERRGHRAELRRPMARAATPRRLVRRAGAPRSD